MTSVTSTRSRWGRVAAAAARVRLDLPLAALDMILCASAYAGVLILRFDGSVPEAWWQSFRPFVIAAILVHVGVNWAGGSTGTSGGTPACSKPVTSSRRGSSRGACSGPCPSRATGSCPPPWSCWGRWSPRRSWGRCATSHGSSTSSARPSPVTRSGCSSSGQATRARRSCARCSAPQATSSRWACWTTTRARGADPSPACRSSGASTTSGGPPTPRGPTRRCWPSRPRTGSSFAGSPRPRTTRS